MVDVGLLRSRIRSRKDNLAEVLSGKRTLLEISVYALLMACIYKIIYIMITYGFLENPLAVFYVEVHKDTSHVKNQRLNHCSPHNIS